MRRTKIVCTIGPGCESVDTLKKMMQAGMNVARLNFSHGTYEEHQRRINAVRKAAAEEGCNVALLLDTRGPEIRIGKFKEEPVQLKAGNKVILTTDDIEGDSSRIHVNYPGLPADVTTGNSILIADGLIELKVLNTSEREIECEIVNGGQLTSQKGVNVPNVIVNLPSLTEQDIKDIKFGIEHKMDFIAASFVRKAADVLAIREILEEADADLDIIAKIENRQGVENLNEIVKVADGIMVARGDLGVEIPVEEVPLIQKKIIEKCNRLGKPVITATQMLESMIQNPRPTRAETSDVANAIFDGTDAIMLSGETAVGKYPVDAVKTMSRIAERSESALQYEEILGKKRLAPSRTVTDAISYATCATAQDLGAAAIITSTQTGYTSKMVAKYRPKAPVIAGTPVESVLRKMALVWGVTPLLMPPTKSTDEMISTSVDVSLSAGLIKSGDLVVITAGVPVGVHGTTNLIRIHTVGDILARGTGIGPRAVTGTVRIVRTVKDALEKVHEGDILVAPATDRDYIPAIEKAGAIITEVGGLTSHAAIVGLQFGIPVIVGVEGAAGILPDGETVTVDGQRGLVYSGVARVL
ncbi:pyruvate kinase [Desulfolucanica intricata]|uniref:pyruvate kinase n=1 Tax=Desulfolucanica intricata TaxID=1285191 RepID=UPI00082C7A1E|nr:pyruvate kinase [Desulfolucanica intricata]